MSSSRHVALAPDVVLQVIGDEALLLKLEQEVVFALNPTGARIAELISTYHDVATIIEVLAGEYGLGAAEIADDVNALLESLAARQLVTLTPGEASRT